MAFMVVVNSYAISEPITREDKFKSLRTVRLGNATSHKSTEYFPKFVYSCIPSIRVLQVDFSEKLRNQIPLFTLVILLSFPLCGEQWQNYFNCKAQTQSLQCIT